MKASLTIIFDSINSIGEGFKKKLKIHGIFHGWGGGENENPPHLLVENSTICFETMPYCITMKYFITFL